MGTITSALWSRDAWFERRNLRVKLLYTVFRAFDLFAFPVFPQGLCLRAMEISEINRKFPDGGGYGVGKDQADSLDKKKNDNRESQQYYHDF